MIRSKIQTGLGLTVLALLLALLHLQVVGLPAALARRLEARLRFREGAVTFGRIRVSLFEGVVVSDVRVYRHGDPGAPVGQAGRLCLQVHPLAWLRGREGGVSGARIADGRLSVRVQADPGGGRALPERRLDICVPSAEIRWAAAGRRLIVESCEARAPGVRLAARGALRFPPRRPPAPAGPAPAAPDAGPSAAPWLTLRGAAWMDAWDRIAAAVGGSGPVNLEVVFDADPAAPATWDISLRADARNTRWDSVQMDAWRLEGRWRGSAGIGSLEWKNAAVGGVSFPAGRLRAAFDGRTLELREGEARAGAGAGAGPLRLSGTFDVETRELRAALESGFSPHLLAPLLRARRLRPQAALAERFRFDSEPPAGKFEIAAGCGDRPFLRLSGQIQGDACGYRGVSNLLMKTGLLLDWTPDRAVLDLGPILVVRPEGLVQGRARVDFSRAVAEAQGVSSADPRAVAAMLAPALGLSLSRFRFEGPAQLAVSGALDLDGAARHDLDLETDVRRAGLGWALADRCAFTLRLLGDTAYINEVDIEFCRGRIRGSGEAVGIGTGSEPVFRVSAEAADVDFARLLEARSGRPEDQIRGTLSGGLEAAGVAGAGAERRAEGRGWIRIRDGQMFKIPLFGGLSEFLGRIVPGLNLLMRQTDARATFTVKDGRLHTDDAAIEGDVIVLTGRGDYHLDGRLDFDVQVKLFKQKTLLGGLAHMALAPVSKMLSFRLTGTAQNPRWRPAYLPKEMFLIFD